MLLKSYEPTWNKASVLFLAPKLATLSTLMTRPEISVFTEKHQPDWCPDAVKEARAYTVAPFLRNLPKYIDLTRHYFTDFDAVQYLWAESSLGNLNSAQHLLRYDAIDWGFSFTEPQVTKGLTHFLNQSTLACWYFMLALTNNGNVEKSSYLMNDSDKNSFLATAEVLTEVQIENKKRIDIIIKWQSANKKPCLVILECKFGHHITHGQLPSYKKYAKNEVGDNYFLFIIAQKNDEKSKRILKNHHNKEWHKVPWNRLLTRWERLLTSDDTIDVHDFSRFRRTIWNKIAKN